MKIIDLKNKTKALKEIKKNIKILYCKKQIYLECNTDTITIRYYINPISRPMQFCHLRAVACGAKTSKTKKIVAKDFYDSVYNKKIIIGKDTFGKSNKTVPIIDKNKIGFKETIKGMVKI